MFELDRSMTDSIFPSLSDKKSFMSHAWMNEMEQRVNVVLGYLGYAYQISFFKDNGAVHFKQTSVPFPPLTLHPHPSPVFLDCACVLYQLPPPKVHLANKDSVRPCPPTVTRAIYADPPR